MKENISAQISSFLTTLRPYPPACTQIANFTRRDLRPLIPPPPQFPVPPIPLKRRVIPLIALIRHPAPSPHRATAGSACLLRRTADGGRRLLGRGVRASRRSTCSRGWAGRAGRRPFRRSRCCPTPPQPHLPPTPPQPHLPPTPPRPATLTPHRITGSFPRRQRCRWRQLWRGRRAYRRPPPPPRLPPSGGSSCCQPRPCD
ncbi:hypothetical protein PVAP13_9NG095600 [Panicum virgatum]|uniref:Uncharacterized protein n=1 Tax=Panicum virgatum TaxID=38727 RepID=A0A8T0MFS9_PANVG|nr:hypothetical protein PVAP13_9NG095600 [Panicum virgatum]